MATTTVSAKGQISIPPEIRRRLNIKRGTKLHIEQKGQELVLRPTTAHQFQNVAGILRTKGRLSRMLLAERAKDRERGA